MRISLTSIPFLLAALLVVTGCSTREVLTGAAVGGAAYEYSNKRAVDEIEDDYRSGRISREEYDRRMDRVEDRSVVY